MFRKLLIPAVFVVGAVAVGWVGASYIVSNPLALCVVLAIAVCYGAGAFELHRYRQATATLERAVADLSAPPSSLGEWLERLHPSLRSAAGLRIQGERAALPAPTLTPYLVGLLVLLGMLGTLLGMMTTLHGTGMALQSATDLQAIRESIATPVAGLGFAFGTSIAGVAASAMLGLLSALCRRERVAAVQRLDAAIATTLRGHSQVHQREEAFKLLQRQTEAMPALIERLQTMTATIEQQNLLAHERQMARQEAFHEQTEAVYGRLAASVERSLQQSIGEGARAAAAALQPIVETTMAGIARETGALHQSVAQAVQQQADGLSKGFADTASTVTAIWNQALADHRRGNEGLVQDLGGALERFNARFDQGTGELLQSVSTRLDATANNAAQAWSDALSQQLSANEDLAARHQQVLATAMATFEQRAASLVGVVQTSHTDLQASLESADQQRLSAWAQTLDTLAAGLGERWQHAGEQAADRQQQICDTLASTAEQMSSQGQAQARDTIAEISRLVDAASQAPKIAAEVVAELRQKLSDSMVRDTAMLEERSRLLATLETLLDAVNHASTEQRGAVDALIGTSADLLDRVGTRFTDHVQAETGKLNIVAAQIAAGAIDVASLGEAFAAAVQQFGASNDSLSERLQTIETALDKSLVRSDEQLAYYVAQAKEVVDLSMLAQKQIIEDIHRLADKRPTLGAEAA
ncbi:MAG: DUF802 domain-containing protein [Lysobacter sp.]